MVFASICSIYVIQHAADQCLIHYCFSRGAVVSYRCLEFLISKYPCLQLLLTGGGPTAEMLEIRGIAYGHFKNAYSYCKNGQERKKGENGKKGQGWQGERGTIYCLASYDASGTRTRGGRRHIVKVEHRNGVRVRRVFVCPRLAVIVTALKTAAVLAFLVGSLPSVDGGRCAFTQVGRNLFLFLPHPLHSWCRRGKLPLRVILLRRA